MPNWCTTKIIIQSDDEDKLCKFYNLIKKWTEQDYEPNSFGLNWLGNIVGNSGIGSINPSDKKFLACRGNLDALFFDDNEIALTTVTAWSPMLKMWIKLCDKYLSKNNYQIFYTAEESGNDLYCTNDPEYVGMYYIDSYFEGIESNDKLTESEVIAMLDKFSSPAKPSESIEDALFLVDHISPDIEVYIHRWRQKGLEDFH